MADELETPIRTQSDLAAALGLARETVSRALSGSKLVNDSLRKRVLAAAERYGYTPSAAARAMREGRTMNIGVVTLDDPVKHYTHAAIYEFLRGINEGLDAQGYVMSVVRLTDVERSEQQRPRAFRERMFDGVIAVNALPRVDIEVIESLSQDVIWLDTEVDARVGCVRRDEVHAGTVAAEALFAAGHRDLTFVSAKPLPSSVGHYSSGRYRGAAAAARAAGAGMKFEVVKTDMPNDAVAEIVRGSAVIASDAYVARRMAAVCSQTDLRVGDDFSLICCDDAFDMNWWWPELARVRFDRLDMGRQAAGMLIYQLENPGKKRRSIRTRDSIVPGSTLRSI